MNFQETFDALKKKYGEKINLAKDLPGGDKIPTGSLSLDLNLKGGIPKSRITFINGRESVGKTATAYHIISEAQRLYPDKPAGIICMEPADKPWAKANNVDLDRLTVVEAGVGEEAVDMYEALVDTRGYSVLVFDSIGAIIPICELEEESSKESMLKRAKLIKRLMLKTNSRLQPTKEERNETACVFLNHVYDTPDMFKPYAIAGGNAVKMFSSLMLTFNRSSDLFQTYKPDGKPDRESEQIGIEIRAVTEKNKVDGEAPPFLFKFFNRDGWNGRAKAGTYDDFDAIIEFGQVYPLGNPLIIKNKGWYYIGEEKLQGERQLANFLTTYDKIDEWKGVLRDCVLREAEPKLEYT
jgi:RecA/RadA recombinase